MDLADQIDDYICSFEGLGDITMDSLAMFVFIWAVLALFILWLCKFLYNKYVNKEQQSSTTTISSKLNGDKPKRLSEPKEILASKEVKETTAAIKSQGALSRGRLGSSGSTGLRKRINRQASSGPETRKKRFVPPPANVVGPETTSVTWTSHVFRWLYSDLTIVNDLLTTWVAALNESLRPSMEQQGVGIEIVRVLPESPAPALSNLFCNSEEFRPEDMIITCDCDAQPVLQIKTFRQKSGKIETGNYKVTIARLRSRLTAPISYNTLRGEMKIDGFPDIKINMNIVGSIKPVDTDEQQFQDLVSEILTNAIKETTYPIDFAIYASCPRAEMDPADIAVMNPYPNDYLATHNLEHFDHNTFGHPILPSAKRLLVKVLKGEGLQDAKDPYCVIEMDEPAQKNQTGSRQGQSPFWDEHFLFNLNQTSAEILFEVYDRPEKPSDQPTFLGLGLVGIDELTVGPASSQVLTLQPRPYETQQVHGTIYIEFVVIEGADIPAGPRPYKLKEALKISSPAINEHLHNGSDLADAAVKAIQDGALNNGTNGQRNTSTLIIHSVKRNDFEQVPSFKVELNNDGQIEVQEFETEPTQVENDITTESLNSALTASPTNGEAPIAIDDNVGNASELEQAWKSEDENEYGKPTASSSPYANGNGSAINGNSHPTQEPEGDRGRSKQKRNFFGTLKKRLSRSKTRANSADNGGMIPIDLENATASAYGQGGLTNDSRSLSMDRGALTKSNSLVVPSTTLNQSRRSSISESSAISGFSSASTKTYLHESSSLVLETIDNGIKRHFLVPLQIAQKPKWRRKGTKLHIYNDHTFVAKHLSGSGLQCSICMKSIPRRPGKQGYECRDCQLVCHKQCHIRAPQACPNPTILSMELTTLPTI
ncbi:C2CD2 family protein [Megaselia abdita]